MIEWISNWAEQVIVAVIIATIIEMILPKGNNKKYIKAVIGVYVLFTIISPIIGKIMGTDFSNLDFDYETYFKNTNTYQTMSQSLSQNNDQNVEEIYHTNLKADMKNKLLEKGYLASDIILETELEEENQYGKIKKLKLTIAKIKQEEQKDITNSVNTVNIHAIDTIEIGNTNIEHNNKVEESNETIKNNEINELKTYLSNVYEINKKQIEIQKKGGK